MSRSAPGSVDAVLFDAVGTLLHPRPTVDEAYYLGGVRYGSSRTAAELLPRFRAAFARSEAIDEERRDGVTSEAYERARWRQIVEEVFDDLADHESLFAHLWQHFALADHWRLFDDVTSCLTDLQARGMRLGVASNFDSRLRSICGDLAPLDRLPALFISSELGYRKPHAGFFRHIEQALGLSPDRLLMIGDTPTNDYYAALAAGWQALLIDRHDRHRDVPDEHRLRSLAELADRLP
ncbi:MAG: HAD-IA family hydrolase [Pirellulales bacterium]|nr:HAD-IA family hydrolase [Pirellulales bacterium]